MQFKKFKFGFTLVEALVIMTVAAVIVAAATPLVTRKLNVLKSDKNKHGSYECVRIAPGTLYERLVIGKKEQYSRTVNAAECKFTPPPNAENFRVRAVGGGGAGGGPGDLFAKSYKETKETGIKNIENDVFPVPTIFPKTLGVANAASASQIVDNWFQWRTLNTVVNPNAYNAVVTACSTNGGKGGDLSWNSNYDFSALRSTYTSTSAYKSRFLRCTNGGGCNLTSPTQSNGCYCKWSYSCPYDCRCHSCGTKKNPSRCCDSCPKTCYSSSYGPLYSCEGSPSCKADGRLYKCPKHHGMNNDKGGSYESYETSSSTCSSTKADKTQETYKTYQHAGGKGGNRPANDACASLQTIINQPTVGTAVENNNTGAPGGSFVYPYFKQNVLYFNASQYISNPTPANNSAHYDGGTGISGAGRGKEGKSGTVTLTRGESRDKNLTTFLKAQGGYGGEGACQKWECHGASYVQDPVTKEWTCPTVQHCMYTFESLPMNNKFTEDGADGYYYVKVDKDNLIKAPNQNIGSITSSSSNARVGNAQASLGKYNFDYRFDMPRGTKQLAYGEPGKNATMVDRVVPKITGTISVKPGLGGTWDEGKWKNQTDKLNKNGQNGEDTIVGDIVAKGAPGGAGAQKTDVYQMCSIYDRTSGAIDCTQQIGGASNTPGAVCSCNKRLLLGELGSKSALATTSPDNKEPGKGGDGGGSQSVAEFVNTPRWAQNTELSKDKFVYKDDIHRWNGSAYVAGTTQLGPDPRANVNPNIPFKPTGINGTNGAVVITW